MKEEIERLRAIIDTIKKYPYIPKPLYDLIEKLEKENQTIKSQWTEKAWGHASDTTMINTQKIMTASSNPMNKPKLKRGRPRVPELKQRIPYSASISPQTAATFDRFTEMMQQKNKLARTGHMLDMVAQWLIQSRFNPSN